ncbi:MAG TPA: thioredoxin family protein [Flavisolibacter sp.]|nr:thioredoxin family protein [Flavisolibacter sp.]
MLKHYVISFLIVCFASLPAIAQQPSANEVLKKAYRQAAVQHKNVLVIFRASWCGWCNKMDSSIHDPEVRTFFLNNYVITHLTIQETESKKDLENPGAMAIYTKYGGSDEQGIPYWLIFDKDGKLLIDSQMKPGVNAGCPATKKEVAYFIEALKATSHMTPAEASAVTTIFRRND